MIILTSFFAYQKVQFFLRVVLYLALGTLALVVRFYRKKETRKRMDERTKLMMKNTEQDENGKFPWEI